MYFIKVKDSSGRTQFISSDGVEKIIEDKEHGIITIISKNVEFNTNTLFPGGEE